MPTAKHLIEAAAVSSGLASLLRRRLAGRTLVLAYHNVVDSADGLIGDRSLHIPFRRFRAHLDTIEQCCDVVSLDQIGVTSPNQAPRPRVVVTFDDAYRGAIRLGVSELSRRGMRSTVFIPPAFVPDATFWWDDLSEVGGLTDARRAAALSEGRGRDAEIRSLWPGQLTTVAAPPDERCCSMTELRAAVATGQVNVGSHTWSHPNLTRASPHELEDELARPLAWLHQHFSDACLPAISYPYGLETRAVCEAAKSAGYTLGFRIDGGWIPERIEDTLRLPRLNVPAGLSADGLALRLAGLLAA